MKDETTILLYALSTIAQTGAALAAFMGAVGIYRLQLLVTSHGRTEDTIRGIMAQRISPELSIDEIVDAARRALTNPDLAVNEDQREPLGRSLAKWDGFNRRYSGSRQRLILFEAWNLVVVVGSLLAFIDVERLARSGLAEWFIGVAALVTGAITLVCVWKWSGD